MWTSHPDLILTLRPVKNSSFSASHKGDGASSLIIPSLSDIRGRVIVRWLPVSRGERENANLSLPRISLSLSYLHALSIALQATQCNGICGRLPRPWNHFFGAFGSIYFIGSFGYSSATGSIGSWFLWIHLFHWNYWFLLFHSPSGSSTHCLPVSFVPYQDPTKGLSGSPGLHQRQLDPYWPVAPGNPLFVQDLSPSSYDRDAITFFPMRTFE